MRFIWKEVVGLKLCLAVAFVLCITSSFAQPWLETYSNFRSGDLTLKEHKQAFDNYWKDKSIVNGYYTENGVKKKAFGWKQFKRWENFWETRVDKNTGAFPTVVQIDKAEREYNRSNSFRSVTGNWTNLGPSSSSGGYAGVGRINTIAFHPSNSNVFWVGTPAGGLWRTTNGGANWTVLTDGNDVLGVSAIAIPSDYATSNIIYIGTGDRDAKDNYSIGVLKSTDGGTTWNATGLTFNLANRETVNKLLIHPSNNSLLYAATTDGVYKTTNAGVSWTKILNSSTFDLEFNPGDPSVIYASNKGGQIIKLTNDGASFLINYDESANGARRIELAVSPASPSVVYGVVVNNLDNGLKEIVKSTDNGNTFTTVYYPDFPANSSYPNILGWDSDGGDDGGQGWYDLALEVDPTNSNIVYCGGINTWKSTDGGVTWAINSHWSNTCGGSCVTVHADKHYLAFNGNTLYECNDGGLYSTTNGGTTWLNISNGIINSQIYSLGVSQTDVNMTVTGLQDNGSKLFDNNSWYDVNGGDGMECIIDYTNANTQYTSVYYGVIERSYNLWGNSTDITPLSAAQGAWETPYVLDPVNSNIIYAGYENIWKSTNQGDSWTQISTMSTSDKLRSLRVAPSNTQVIYTADLTTIWTTTNGGTSWSDVTSNLPVGASYITSIAIKNDDPNTVWVTMGSYNANVVYETTNGGTSWTNISTGLPSVPASTIVQNKQNTTEVELYVGTDYGVYLKRGSNNWVFFNTGLPKVVITELEIYYNASPSSSRLRAATFGRGLWESDLFSNSSFMANFNASNVTPSTSETVSFTDLTNNTPTSWTWSFSPNTVTYQASTNANSQNPQVTFDNPGMYTVTLDANNGSDYDSEIKTNYINVSPGPSGYCSSVYTQAGGEFITNVMFNTISNSTGDDNGYGNYTTQSTDVKLSSVYQLDVTINTFGDYVDSCYVFFDWNADGDFYDAGETYYLGFVENTSAGLLSQNITIPGNASLGNTRMRVIVEFIDGGGPCDFDQISEWGETEDYIINIIPNTTYCASVYSELNAEFISYVSFNTINNSSGDDLGYANNTLQSTDVLINNVYQLDVTINTVGDFKDTCYAYFDWNGDYDFYDAGEQYYLGFVENTPAGLLSQNITIPSDAAIGSTRMRIVMEYHDGGGPCESDQLSEWGETEDYSINIISPITWTNQPTNLSISCNDSDLPAVTGNAAATTSCGSNGLLVNYSDVLSSGSCVNSSVITRTWTATDNCSNLISYDQIITVEDNNKPSLSCPSYQSQLSTNGIDTLLRDYTILASVNDNCSQLDDIVLSQSPAIGSLQTVGEKSITIQAIDECGNIATCSFNVEISSVITSISENELTGVSIYPNPTNGLVYVKGDIKNKTIKVFNSLGQNVIEGKNIVVISDNEANVDLGAYAKGIYFISIDGSYMKIEKQ